MSPVPQQPVPTGEEPGASTPEQPEEIPAGKHVRSYRITIQAPAAELYALVADPHRHHEFDGSETVRPSAVGPHRLEQGSRFSVHMKKYGVPYRLPLRVTQAVSPAPGRTGVLEWRQPTGHRWRWEFTADDDAGSPRTVVTESYDASSQNRLVRTLLGAAGIPAENARSIRASLQRLRQSF
ncbi:SRPBCC family protein [Nesterenkonia massiliensis]|uniref:SRPBCC family protein n=1 Tax=Nesterenkonia massiliensis TaxID=1232429 RepID=UPI0003FE2F72|nr:SRPBCC family protein [Nesterenkonia massiliensis]